MTQKKIASTSVSYGRKYFLRYLLDSLVLNYLGNRATKHLTKNYPQLAISAFDGIGNTINIRGIYELEHLITITQWLNHNQLVKGCALDIGANIGNHSVYFSQYYEHVYSFEPNPRTYQLLNINAQAALNITAYNYGLSSTAGTAKLYVNNLNWGGAKIEASNTPSDRVESITLSTLDAQNQLNLKNIGLIKIDVEGHEAEVIKGGIQTILKHKPVILFEQHPSDFVNGSTKSLNFLKENGYCKFASLMPYPYLPLWIPKKIRSVLTIITRFAFGYGFRVTVSSTIHPDFHSLIAAIPEVD